MSRNQKIAICFLVLCYIFFATYRLTESPPFWFDEGMYFQTSANLATTGVDGLQFAPSSVEHVSTFVTVGYPLIYALGFWFKLFGVSVLSGRLFMILCIGLFLLFACLLTKRVYGSMFAIGTLALLATFPPLYGNGKSILGEVPGLLYLVLFLLLFNIAISSANRKLFFIILAGLFAGLTIATKPLFIVLIPAIVVGLWLEWRRKNISLKDTGIFTLATIVPVLVWVVVQFRGGDSLFTILHQYANPYHVGSIVDTVLANIRRLFTDVGTLYTVFIVAIWSWAFALRLWSKEKIATVETIAFVFSTLIFLAFFRTGGLYRYLFPTQAIALIFLPAAIVRVAHFVVRKQDHGKIRERLVVTLIVLLSLLGIYQLSFSSWVADSYNSHKTAFWQEYFSSMSSSHSVFFYTSPEVVPFIGHRNYYQYIKLYDRVDDARPEIGLGSEELPVIKEGLVDEIIIPTNAYETLDKDAIFRLYERRREAYKYSILVRRQVK